MSHGDTCAIDRFWEKMESGFDLLVFKDFLSDAPWEPGKRVLGEGVGPAWG